MQNEGLLVEIIKEIHTDVREIRTDVKGIRTALDSVEFKTTNHEKRINCLEKKDSHYYKLWESFINSPVVAKVIIVIICIVIFGGSATSLVSLL